MGNKCVKFHLKISSACLENGKKRFNTIKLNYLLIVMMLKTADLSPHAGMTTACHQNQPCTGLQGKRNNPSFIL